MGFQHDCIHACKIKRLNESFSHRQRLNCAFVSYVIGMCLGL